jgi:MoxR-like ATPase
MQDVSAVNDQVKEASAFVYKLREEMGKVIVGQRYVVDRLLVGLLSNGHILLEGVPGLAKTLSVKTLAQAIDAKFNRIQFTPDLLPADLVGTLIYNPREGSFSTKRGPIFANIILADEINRAPAKVQSALLEAMQEHQVTIGDETYPLPDPFLVLATQNPIEQEGTECCRPPTSCSTTPTRFPWARIRSSTSSWRATSRCASIRSTARPSWCRKASSPRSARG